MGKFPIADAALAKVWICKRCKSRNRAGAEKCRKCNYRYLRPKRKTLKAKK
jgi:large subunit ribosomal protein L40e